MALLLLAAAPARPDCVLSIEPLLVAPFINYPAVFPNWTKVPTSAFTVYQCDDSVCTGCPTSNYKGLTIQNYGSASGGPAGDIRGVSFQMVCESTNSGLVPMTYAGPWAGVPTWTWAGTIANVTDVCNSNVCQCGIPLYLYTDIAPCPTDGATVQLGFGFNDVLNPAWPGGLTDSCGCAAWSQVADPTPKPIRYVMKQADRQVAAPGDTITYTVWYGRPGTATLSTLWVMDSQPPFTHYVTGSASPAPVPGWDPDPGPPLRLLWQANGPLPVTGGPTGMITFKVTVDWGNGESFEPGSGDTAAPEGAFLFNAAHLSWDPPGGCASGVTSNATSTVVRRYLFWKIGDNDLLFAPRFGQPDDEMVYELFVKNESSQKTWWNLAIWDTVPAQLDAWAPGFGFEDPCAGWTMTPTGCAAATPGRVLAGANTLLTWRLDLPPLMTLSLRWKGRLKPTTGAGQTVVNEASVLELGRAGIVGGTGHAGVPKVFRHEALVILRTSYISYVGWEADSSDFFKGCSQTYFISFYPLNKASDFALYRKWCCSAAPCDTGCAGFAANGGVSLSIDVFAGTCTGGPPTDWETGCKVERSPARFVPAAWRGANPNFPFNFLHKLVANAPVIWELATCFDGGGDDDADTYAGTSSLTFCGLIAYSYTQALAGDAPTMYYVSNTDATLPTTLHVFEWDPAALAWKYVETTEMYQESQWAFWAQNSNHYRFVSSQGRIMALKASPCPLSDCTGAGNKYHDFGTMVPNKENGNLVSAAAPATFYAWVGEGQSPNPSHDVCVVGNVGAAKATYEVWRYQPFDPTIPSTNFSVNADLVGSAGSWNYLATHTVDPGLAAPLNGHVYGDVYDVSNFYTRFRHYKIVLLSGGPIQVQAGRGLFDAYAGGSMLHAAKDEFGNPGAQTGREFWWHTAGNARSCQQVFDVFCPKQAMVVNMTSGDGYSATYTTAGIDQAVAFREMTPPALPLKRNWRANVLLAGNPGNATAQFFYCEIAQKYYTAPFMQQGVFYNIVAPPVVFAGQPFWITVIVTDTGGGTKTDYCGTSSFTATDPKAQIEGQPMDAYNFTWSSSVGPCSLAPDENGVRVFVNVTLSQLGLQSLVAADVADGSIVGLATVMVVGADVRLLKTPRLSIAASGDTVQFRVCWSNYSSASAFSFTVTDAVPVGTAYVPDAATAMDCGNAGGVPVAVAYSLAVTPAVPPPGSFTTISGATAPPAATRWLRWTVPYAGVNSTGCFCYRISVN